MLHPLHLCFRYKRKVENRLEKSNMTHELGELWLERDFEALDVERNPTVIKLRVGKPYQSEINSDWKWRCPLQLIGIGTDKIKTPPGYDGIDAIISALRLADGILKAYSKHYNQKITWLGEEYLGFSNSPEIEIQKPNENTDKSKDNEFERIFEEFFVNLKSKGSST